MVMQTDCRERHTQLMSWNNKTHKRIVYTHFFRGLDPFLGKAKSVVHQRHFKQFVLTMGSVKTTRMLTDNGPQLLRPSARHQKL